MFTPGDRQLFSVFGSTCCVSNKIVFFFVSITCNILKFKGFFFSFISCISSNVLKKFIIRIHATFYGIFEHMWRLRNDPTEFCLKLNCSFNSSNQKRSVNCSNLSHWHRGAHIKLEDEPKEATHLLLRGGHFILWIRGHLRSGVENITWSARADRTSWGMRSSTENVRVPRGFRIYFSVPDLAPDDRVLKFTIGQGTTQ